MIVVDEHCSLVLFMTNPTILKNCTLAQATFITHLCDAKTIITAHTDLTDERLESIEKVTSTQFYKMDYTHKNLKDRSATIYTESNRFMNYLIKT